MTKRIQTPKEELANAISHGTGLLLGVIAIPFLLQKSLEKGDFPSLIAVSAFALGVIMVYANSTLYHAIRTQKLKDKFQILDHISIYFLIAGSYSPMILAVLPFQKALIFLSILWGAVLIGSFFKLFFTGRFKKLSISIYLLMGWISVFFIQEILEKVSAENLSWIGLGGLCYTVGVYFYLQSHKSYYHSIWHLFVLAGTATHFVAVYQIV
jgi:hemolysin III